MKTEKEILCEFVGLVFQSENTDSKDVYSNINLMKGSLTSVRMAANDALEICSHMSKSEQERLNSKMLKAGLPSLFSLQHKAFKEFLKISNRGSIRNEKEFYLVSSLSENSILNKEHQNTAYSLLESYELPRT